MMMMMMRRRRRRRGGKGRSLVMAFGVTGEPSYNYPIVVLPVLLLLPPHDASTTSAMQWLHFDVVR